MSPPSPRKPLQARSQKTEQNLVTALEQLLCSKSISELTVAEIAIEAGVTTGAIYRRFRDKQDLLRAAFDRFLEKAEENGGRLVSEGKEMDDRELMRHAIEGTLHFTLQNIAIMRAASSLNDLASFERMRSARNLVADIVAKHLASSGLPPEELQHRARFTFRVVTAVGRDTFLAGPGASGAGLATADHLNEKNQIIQQLASDLMDTTTPYLQI